MRMSGRPVETALMHMLLPGDRAKFPRDAESAVSQEREEPRKRIRWTAAACPVESVETRTSWVVAMVALVVLSVSCGAR